ncbi:MAG: hypothetical protein ACE5GY_05775 [Thermodesulfobacteriota bacterium]
MSLYSQLTPKPRRTVRNTIDLVCSVKGIIVPQTIQELKKIGVFSPCLKFQDRQIFLSSDATMAVRRITNFIHDSKRFSDLVDYNDIFRSILEISEHWLANNLKPDEQEFLDSLDEHLVEKITTSYYFNRIEGLELTDIDKVQIGTKTVRVYSSEVLAGVDFDSDLKDIIDKEYSGKLIILGEEHGSSTISESRFYYHSTICLSLLSLYSCAIYKSAIRRIKLRLIGNSALVFGVASTVSWSKKNKEGTFARHFGAHQDFELNAELLKYLYESCYFTEMSNLLEKPGRSDLEESVVKAIYWFGAAQNEHFHAATWIKLWTCLECFFTLDRVDITETNARGIASLLLFGDYNIDDYGDYSSLKAKIKSFYDARSKILHNADYTDIDPSDLDELANMVAWVIITIVSLLPRGYTTRKQLQEEVRRLDNIQQFSRSD